LQQAPHRPRQPHILLRDAQLHVPVRPHLRQVHVVHAHHFAPLGINDLLVQQILPQPATPHSAHTPPAPVRLRSVGSARLPLRRPGHVAPPAAESVRAKSGSARCGLPARPAPQKIHARARRSSPARRTPARPSAPLHTASPPLLSPALPPAPSPRHSLGFLLGFPLDFLLGFLLGFPL